MAIQHAVSILNTWLDAIETDIGTSPVLKILTGSKGANVAAGTTGTVLATLTLPSDWMAAASGGSKSKSGTWEDTSADATGTAGHFELYQSDGTTLMQIGSVTATGGGGDMTVDNTSFAAGQSFTITGYTISFSA